MLAAYWQSAPSVAFSAPNESVWQTNLQSGSVFKGERGNRGQAANLDRKQSCRMRRTGGFFGNGFAVKKMMPELALSPFPGCFPAPESNAWLVPSISNHEEHEVSEVRHPP